MGDDADPVQGPAGPVSQRATVGPLSSRSARLAASQKRSSDSEAPPSAGSFDGEDFLYHLYRGSELLQDNCVPQAKEELERALKLQPQDTEGQGLLGVVYFRLGLYLRGDHQGGSERDQPAREPRALLPQDGAVPPGP
jgi:hypothetical protein